jgi:hypothetical protein
MKKAQRGVPRRVFGIEGRAPPTASQRLQKKFSDRIAVARFRV